jgi:putative transposase
MYMPRVARIFTEEGVFHILTRGNNKQRIFYNDADFLAYRKILKELKEEHPFNLYHWCLMPNHVHMVIETNKETNLSQMMKRLNLIYYNHFKRKYGYTGHFWQDRFKSLLIERDEYLSACGLYIEKNPVKAKIVKSPENYPHSSYSYYAYGQKDELMDRNPIYNELGHNGKERQRAYRELILDKEKNINSATFNQLFLGSKKFVEKMERRYKVKNVRLKKGRPKKKKK